MINMYFDKYMWCMELKRVERHVCVCWCGLLKCLTGCEVRVETFNVLANIYKYKQRTYELDEFFDDYGNTVDTTRETRLASNFKFFYVEQKKMHDLSLKLYNAADAV